MKKNKPLLNTVNFFFEVGMLAKTPRSGFHFLGTGEQSVAEHVNRTTFIAYALAQMDKSIDTLKVLKMALFHDISETRISDLNHIHQKYVERKEHSAVTDISESVPFGDDVYTTLGEYEKRESKEAMLVKDADTLEWLLALKEQVDTGNTRALAWMKDGMKRLKTKNGIELGRAVLDINSNDWWFPKNSVIRRKKYIK